MITEDTNKLRWKPLPFILVPLSVASIFIFVGLLSPSFGAGSKLRTWLVELTEDFSETCRILLDAFPFILVLFIIWSVLASLSLNMVLKAPRVEILRRLRKVLVWRMNAKRFVKAS